MYLVGDTILCVQDHPEYDAGYIAGLVEARRPRMGDEVTDAALERIAARPTRTATSSAAGSPTSCSTAAAADHRCPRWR